MANEFTLSATWTVTKPSIAADPLVFTVPVGIAWSIQGSVYNRQTILVATGGTALIMGQVTQPHFAYFHNLDPTNYITIANAQGNNPFMRLLQSEYSFVSLDPGVLPWCIANSAACFMEYGIVQL